MLGQQGGSGVVARAKVRTVKVFYLNSNLTKVFNKVSNMNLNLNLKVFFLSAHCQSETYLFFNLYAGVFATPMLNIFNPSSFGTPLFKYS